ncbi:5-amino-6-(D-ribitylamino)uracil--L-tyrosine 4-hydroxyphenyl transferase CofH [Halioxenophilus sp. WMMB6]|uniref:5-amino-6-(D-ribitylamino)uracil--L-tyrosine 4-hydroxyphenyl transferase CofH n=1 Tax=Halioxenophilus sp. WMMB6 TaxID=3073815 RepID=UPI00295ECACA|nr:5-amino-6-(D-ribitylamino)uracil--L-tyrosine 4-hydroxyphenyl transferase CofH [Halioxenophilus sp. WMMB6]
MSRSCLSRAEAFALEQITDWRALAPQAQVVRNQTWGNRVSYSRKVFIPLTQLCRDVCHYCTFAHTPNALARAYLTPEEVLDIARAGQAQGCKEALFTLGDQPEARYRVAREALEEMGFENTLAYLAHVAQLVLDETGLLPHLNPGLMSAEDFQKLKSVAPSMGIMLESGSERLCQKGGPHYGSPDKLPERRLQSLRLAGEAKVPMTSGILIGIGETRRERLESLWQLRELAEQYGHLQEVIVQNFRAKPGTKMAAAAEPGMDDLCWTIACARLILPPEVSIQAPPNLYQGDLTELIAAGINDWGGVSPVTPDHVNPEAPWPHLAHLAEETERAGAVLVERLTAYPRFVQNPTTWLAESVQPAVLRLSDGGGWARVGQWSPGSEQSANSDDLADISGRAPGGTAIPQLLARLQQGEALSEAEIAELFTARGEDFTRICQAADNLRQQSVGASVSFAVVRNINYTNICQYQCRFCAFSKGRAHENLRGEPYRVELDEIARRVREAWDRGATEVCMQGGIHPDFDGNTYLEICRAAKAAVPEIHVHAFSPLEVAHGAQTLGLSVGDYLRELKAAGLGSLPGTAAEILDDQVRSLLAPDKMPTDEWLAIVRQAHQLGLCTTATIMFGHIDGYQHWARHLQKIRTLQAETGGFTEFVPLPFVHMEAPMYLRGRARRGPTLRETLLMHAIARLVLHPLITNIQVSWVKLGPQWAQRCLQLGVNDLGGTLMNESISRAAGASYGQELPPAAMIELIDALGRSPRQRNTLYQTVAEADQQRALQAAELIATSHTPLRRQRPHAAAAQPESELPL